jgi:hypothetical protein
MNFSSVIDLVCATTDIEDRNTRKAIDDIVFIKFWVKRIGLINSSRSKAVVFKTCCLLLKTGYIGLGMLL